MSDMTLAAALAGRERQKERMRRMERQMRAAAKQEKRVEKAKEKQAEKVLPFLCSFGQHRTYKHAYLNEEFAGGTICMHCQLDIVSNVETVIELPAVTEAIARQARARHLEKKQDAIMAKIRKEADPDAEGWVYYMRINGQIKIGYTKNLRKRSRAYPPGTELIAVEPGSMETERRRHSQFSRDLAQGREWFAESDALVDHMKKLTETFIVPTALMHSYSKHEGIKRVRT